MMEEETTRKVPQEKRASEYLANERTFLAWIRTSMAVISLGFVVAKFSVWLHQLAARIQPGLQLPHKGESLPMGVAMMVFGAILAVLATWRYHIVNKCIERGQVSADRGLVILVTVLVVLLAGGMVFYMIQTSEGM